MKVASEVFHLSRRTVAVGFPNLLRRRRFIILLRGGLSEVFDCSRILTIFLNIPIGAAVPNCNIGPLSGYRPYLPCSVRWVRIEILDTYWNIGHFSEYCDRRFRIAISVPYWDIAHIPEIPLSARRFRIGLYLKFRYFAMSISSRL